MGERERVRQGEALHALDGLRAALRLVATRLKHELYCRQELLPV